jgi:hypothetical protein
MTAATCDGHCPLYPADASVRVHAWRLLGLWALEPRPCALCRIDPETGRLTDDELATLAGRYGVPAGRLP